jgi:hypothetical protein
LGEAGLQRCQGEFKAFEGFDGATCTPPITAKLKSFSAKENS